MKVTVNRDEFLAAFNLCAKVAPTNPQRPILGNVLMEVGESDILLVANDGQTCMRVRVPHVDFEGLGSTLLPKSRFHAILNSHHDDTLVISAESRDSVMVKTVCASYTLNIEDPEDFPQCPEDTANLLKHIVDAAEFASLIRMTAFAVDTVGKRWATSGVLVESGVDENREAKLVLVSCDGRRLAKASVACDIEMMGTERVVQARGTISPRFANLVLDCLRGVEGPVGLTMGKYCSVLEAGRTTLSSQLVSGDFPPYSRILEKRDSGTISLNCGSFRRAVEQASAMADDVNSSSVLFRFSKLEIVLKAGTDDKGTSEVSLPIDVGIDPIDIALNPRYVTQALTAIGDKAEILLDISGSLGPVVIRVEGRGYTYVVMPMSSSNVPTKSKKK